MNPVDWFVSAIEALRKLYNWLVKGHLRNRSEAAARSAPTASVIRSGCVKLHWYERPAARELQHEGHGTVSGGYYEVWVNATPPGVLMAMELRALNKPRGWNG